MAKSFRIAPNGFVVKQDYSNARNFHVELAPADDIHSLLKVLQRIETEPNACIIRGAPNAATNLNRTTRRRVENGGNFDDKPRSYLMLDLDKVKLPAGSSVVSDPQDVARIVVDLVASYVSELEGVTAIVQFSSSAGLDEQAEAEEAAGLPPRWHGVVKRGAGVGVHLWYWLEEAVGGAELDRWAAAVNARVGHKFIDPATLRTVQPHYTASPVFGDGLRDPLVGRRTLLVEGWSDAATLDIPASEPRRPYKPGSSSIVRLGYSGCLDAIGGPDGFHDPINRAIASFVATNWPQPDTDALKADLVARIRAADPGGRSQSDIERYARNVALDARIAWTIGREEEKRAAIAREADQVASHPIAPTYPDRGVPLDEASRLTGSALATFAAKISEGKAPQLCLRMDVGSGKTFEVINVLPALLAGGRNAGRGPAVVTHPRHKLGDQIAADISARHPHLRIAVWRGMDADDPANPGKRMCQDRELSGAAKAAGQSATAGCVACSISPVCSYLLQIKNNRDADVWVAPHQALFLTPFPGWPRVEKDGHRQPILPSVVIIDEDIASASLAGLDPGSPVRFALSSLESTDTPNVQGIERDLLLHRRRRFLETLNEHPGGALFRNLLFDDHAVAAAKEWSKLEWATRPRVRLPGGTTRAAALMAFADAEGLGFTRLRPMLGEWIAAFLEGNDTRSVNLSIELDADLGRGQGTGRAVRFAWRQDFHHGWAGPLLFLDATGRPEVLRHWAPEVEIVDIEVSAPHQHVVQVLGQEFGRKWLQLEGNLRAAADALLIEVARAGGEVLAIAQVAVEALLRDELTRREAVRDTTPEGGYKEGASTWRFPSGAVLHLAHHGDVTGSNAWQHVTTIVVIGRPAMDRLAGERMAEVIGGKAITTVADTPGSWWPTTTSGLRMADGSSRAVVRQPWHPDPLVEAYRWTVTEGAVLQAIGRGRGVRRTAANPVRVVVMAALALPQTVEEATPWNEFRPKRLEVAVAEAALFRRAVPLAPADLAADRPDLWPTRRSAELYFEREGRFETPQTLIEKTYKGLRGFKDLVPARYRKGLRGRWSLAVLPRGCEHAALTDAVGKFTVLKVEGDAPLPSSPPSRAYPAGGVRFSAAVSGPTPRAAVPEVIGRGARPADFAAAMAAQAYLLRQLDAGAAMLPSDNGEAILFRRPDLERSPVEEIRFHYVGSKKPSPTDARVHGGYCLGLSADDAVLNSRAVAALSCKHCQQLVRGGLYSADMPFPETDWHRPWALQHEARRAQSEDAKIPGISGGGHGNFRAARLPDESAGEPVLGQGYEAHLWQPSLPGRRGLEDACFGTRAMWPR